MKTMCLQEKAGSVTQVFVPDEGSVCTAEHKGCVRHELQQDVSQYSALKGSGGLIAFYGCFYHYKCVV